jgi:transposase
MKGILAAGLSARQIARQMGCSPSTITRLAQRIALTGSVNDRPHPGRRRVTSPNQDRLIQLRHLRDRFLTATQTAQHMQSIIGRRLCGVGFDLWPCTQDDCLETII